MRYLLFLCLLVLTLPVLGYNEVVSAISYNPSRLGAYTHLKVVQKAELSGGLLQQSSGGRLNVLSKGTVSMQCGGGECASNAITNIKPVGALEDACASQSSLCDQWQTSQKGGNLQGTSNGGTVAYMYGGNLGNKASTTAIINAISLNNGATLNVNAGTLTVPSLVVQDSLVLGGVSIASPSVSGGSYKFVTRVTDDKKKRNVLCIK